MSIVQSASVSRCARWSSRLQCYVLPGGPVHFLSTSVSCCARWSIPLQCHVEPGGPFHVTWSPVVRSMSRGARWSIPLQCHVVSSGPFHFSVRWSPVVQSTSVSRGARWSIPLQCHVGPGGASLWSRHVLHQPVSSTGPKFCVRKTGQ